MFRVSTSDPVSLKGRTLELQLFRPVPEGPPVLGLCNQDCGVVLNARFVADSQGLPRGPRL